MKNRGCNKKRYRGLIIAGMLAILFLAAGIIVVYQMSLRFSTGTSINGVDCSFLTVPEVEEKLNTELLSSNLITFTVLTKKEDEYLEKRYVMEKDFINLSFDGDLQDLLDLQKESHVKTFSLTYEFDESSLREFLLTIEEFQEENQIQAEDAYLEINEGRLEIIEEVYGLIADFESAYDKALIELQSGNFDIDFTYLFETEPMVLSTDESLVENQKKINAILDTSITIKFTDGTEEILDRSTFSNWIVQDSDGLFYLDESNITSYVDYLAETVNNKNAYIQFNATGIDPVNVFVKQSLRAQLDTEAEFTSLREAIYAGGTQTLELVYDRTLPTASNSYVELDITRQKLWLYIDGSCILETDVVTGSVAEGHATPTGLYYLTYKTLAATLRGYNSDGSLAYASYVDYWMPFNGGIGFHDASWRSEFGGDIYLTNGSHGCVNMPFNAAQTLYQYINTEMSIFVYAS